MKKVRFEIWFALFLMLVVGPSIVAYEIATHKGPWGMECDDGTRRFSCNWANAAWAKGERLPLWRVQDIFGR